MKNKLINHILFYCGNFKKHEKLLVIYDNQSKHVFFEFKKFLNNHFKIKKNLRYWKILIGPWLMGFITAYYEKNLLIEKLLNKKEKLKLTVYKFPLQHMIPKNFLSYFDLNLESSAWQDYLFSLIIEKKKIRQNISIKKIKKFYRGREISKFQFLSYLKNNLFKILYLVFYFRTKTQPLIFFDTYLSFKNKILLVLKNLSLPFQMECKEKNISANLILRNSIARKINLKIIFK